MLKLKKKINYITSNEMKILLRHYKKKFIVEKMYCDYLGVKHYYIETYNNRDDHELCECVYINYNHNDKDLHGEVVVE